MRKSLQYKLFSIILLLSLHGALTAQDGQWTWIKGADTANPKGEYGLLNTSDPANNPGGRRGGVSWTDTAGNYWIFGGNGYGATGGYGYINDLWKYNKNNNTWTWMSGGKTINQPSVYGTRGVAAATNTPGARTGALAWADTQGNLWLFGGITYDYKYISDVWKYSIATNQWTWVKGDTSTSPGVYGVRGVAAPANTPAGRCFPNGWYDPAGKLYLFGGQSSDLSISWYNDLWVYNLSSNQWTWINGDSVANNLGIYGTQNQPAATNKPGSRSSAFSWRDLQGNCWMMGGLGYSETTYDYLNDLWKYNPATNQWTWVKGSKTGNQGGQYGTLGVPDAFNIPGCRLLANTWTDKEGSLWLLGGRGLAEASAFGDMNDFWKFNIATNNWTWMGGDKTTYANGVYGTRGQPSLSNKPGAREQSFTWTDASGNLWLMGGGGYAALGGNEYFLNDVWKYKPVYALPVHLLAFTARRQDDTPVLEWWVENEVNFAHYELQRSNDGRQFSPLGVVKPRLASGHNQYSFADKTAMAFSGGTNSIWYRLKMIDRDGSFTYSHIVQLALNKQPEVFTLYPNPASAVVQLQFSGQFGQPVSITITNSEGKVVVQKSNVSVSRSMSISVSQLPAGNYTVLVTIGNRLSSQSLMVVK